MVARIGEALVNAEEENSEFSPKQWNDVHLRCMNISCRLPSASRSAKPSLESYGKRICLLDWVERSMRITLYL
jgi:hypothetical protein